MERAGRGGVRPGAGRPKGSKETPGVRLTKQAMRDIVQDVVRPQLEPLVRAQMAQAMGLKFLVTRDRKTGKFIRVGPAMARNRRTEETIEVWQKDPSTSAFIELMNRLLDKSAEQLRLTGPEGGGKAEPITIRWLDSRDEEEEVLPPAPTQKALPPAPTLKPGKGK